MSKRLAFPQLLNEYNSSGPSGLWLKRIAEISAQVTRSGFPASIYAKSIEFPQQQSDVGSRWGVEDSTSIWGNSWSPEAIGSLADDVFMLLTINHSPIGMSFQSIVESVVEGERHARRQNLDFDPNSFVGFLLKRAVFSTLRLRTEKGLGSRFFGRLKTILESDPFIRQGHLPSNDIDFGGVAYGIVGRTQLKPLDLPELGKASLLIRSFPVEKSVIADDERRNQKRWFTDSTLKVIAESIATDLQAAVTTRFLLRALKNARPEAFPLEIQSAGTASEAGRLSGKNMSPTNVVWGGNDAPRSLEIEVMAEEISARIVSQLDGIDGRMTVALALQSLGKTLRSIGTRWNISGQYVGQLITRAHEVVREEYKRMTINLQLSEPEIAQMQASVIGLVLASCRHSVGDIDAD